MRPDYVSACIEFCAEHILCIEGQWTDGQTHFFKNRVSQLFLASARTYTESNDRYTCFQRLLCLLCQIFQQFVYLLSLFIHLSNANFVPRKDTVRTHRCPVGLVWILDVFTWGNQFVTSNDIDTKRVKETRCWSDKKVKEIMTTILVTAHWKF